MLLKLITYAILTSPNPAKYNHFYSLTSRGKALILLMSSLKISASEQARFIQKLVNGELPVTTKAAKLTQELLFLEDLPDDWKLFGKTGWSGSSTTMEIRWFVGWIKKESRFFPFGYNLLVNNVSTGLTIPPVKELLAESTIMHHAKETHEYPF